MNKEQLEALKQGFVQLSITAFIYLMWIILGFISVITIGFILEKSFILLWVQGVILLCTNLTGIYFSHKFLQD